MLPSEVSPQESDQHNADATRLFTKLALFLIPAFTLPSAVGLFWLATSDIDAEHDRLTARIGNSAARVAGAIERHLEEFPVHTDHQNLNESQLPQALVSTLLSDQAVLCVELIATNSGKAEMIAPAGIGCKGQIIDASIEIPVLAEEDHDLVIYLSMEEIKDARKSRRDLSFLMLIGGLIIALIASWCGFRLIVNRPLGKLLRAIRQSKQQGVSCDTDRQTSADHYALVDHRANDELGHVASAFNDMQHRLGAEARRVEQTLDSLNRVYNSTPTLLYSTDDRGIIVSVSDHWLYSTGYERGEVVGHPVRSFLKDSSKKLFTTNVEEKLARFEAVNDVPLILCCKDRCEIDILLSAVREPSNDQKNTETLCVMSDISALKAVERKLARLALTDPLSGLSNRRGLLENLDHLLQQPAIEESPSAVFFIDLDDFKWINDTYGHEAGDALLIAASARLYECTRSGDLVARIGGDEFAIVYKNLRNHSAGETLAARIIESFKEPFVLGDVLGFVSASIGIAYIDKQADAADGILRLADLAMYKAKQLGKATFVTYTNSLGQQVHEAAEIRDHIRHGMEQNLFSLNFQPIVDLKTGLPIGGEVLLRLTSPKNIPIRPDIFIPVAEETGQIIELGTFVLEEGIKALSHLKENHENPNFYLAINLSPKQLNNQFDGVIDKALASHPELAHHLVLEITETMLLQRSDDIFKRLYQLHQRGIRIALDDFGTGYSSLSHIQNFPVDIIKIDKSFIQQLSSSGEERQRALAMVRATTTMAHDLGIRIVAEGVEDESILHQLGECRIDLLQGYLYAKPLPFDAFCAWLHDHEPVAAPLTEGNARLSLTQA